MLEALGVITGGSPLPVQVSGTHREKINKEFDSTNATFCFSQEDKADGSQVFQAEIGKVTKQMVEITWL